MFVNYSLRYWCSLMPGSPWWASEGQGRSLSGQEWVSLCFCLDLSAQQAGLSSNGRATSASPVCELACWQVTLASFPLILCLCLFVSILTSLSFCPYRRICAFSFMHANTRFASGPHRGHSSLSGRKTEEKRAPQRHLLPQVPREGPRRTGSIKRSGDIGSVVPTFSHI